MTTVETSAMISKNAHAVAARILTPERVTEIADNAREAAKTVEASAEAEIARLSASCGETSQSPEDKPSLLAKREAEGYKDTGFRSNSREIAKDRALLLRSQGQQAVYQTLSKHNFGVWARPRAARSERKQELQPNEAGHLIERDREIGRLAIQRRTDSPYGEDTVEIQFPGQGSPYSGPVEVEITTASWRGTIEQTEEFARQLLAACKLARKGL